MRYFPMLQAMLESDSVIFLLIGVVCAVCFGMMLKKTKKSMVAAGISLLVYMVCEIISNVRSNFMAEFVLLFIGTAALGGVIGFLISALVCKRKDGKVE